MVAGTFDKVVSMARHTRIPVRQHHVIVHRDGKVYFRVSAAMPSDRLYYVRSITWGHSRIFRLTFAPIPPGEAAGRRPARRLLPSRQGTAGLCFYDKQFAATVVPAGREHVRLRITRRTRRGYGNTFRIWLSALPVRDLCSIWQNMAAGIKEKATLRPKKRTSCKKPPSTSQG